jgi:tryptophan-rich sensory protein
MDKQDFYPKVQPAGWVFGVVWTILYLFMGFYMYYLFKNININGWTKHTTILAILFTFMMIVNLSWIPTFSCYKKKKTALYLLGLHQLISMTLVTASLIHKDHNIRIGGVFLTPLVWWLFCASYLNAKIVENI